MLGKLKSAIDRLPTRLTKAGWWYVGAATLTSAAAYHSASNVLFLALAFFLSALLLNGLISWWNYSQIEFGHLKTAQLRAQDSGFIQFQVRDTKKVMHSLGLTAVLEIQPRLSADPPTRIKAMIHYPDGFKTGQTMWVSIPWRPEHRGYHSVRLCQIESYFPFGLLLKTFFQELSTDIIVWPAKGEEGRNLNSAGKSLSNSNERVRQSVRATAADADELSGLRSYQRGDPMRSVNWKKSAQHRRPMVIENRSKEKAIPETVCFDFSSHHFASENELHRYCSNIAGWIEGERRQHRQVKLVLHHQPPVFVHNTSTFQHVMDILATIEPQEILARSDFSQTDQWITPRDFL